MQTLPKVVFFDQKSAEILQPYTIRYFLSLLMQQYRFVSGIQLLLQVKVPFHKISNIDRRSGKVKIILRVAHLLQHIFFVLRDEVDYVVQRLNSSSPEVCGRILLLKAKVCPAGIFNLDAVGIRQ